MVKMLNFLLVVFVVLSLFAFWKDVPLVCACEEWQKTSQGCCTNKGESWCSVCNECIGPGNAPKTCAKEWCPDGGDDDDEPPPPSCTISITANPNSIRIGETSLITSQTTKKDGNIDRVSFTSSDPGIATVTSPDNSAPYESTATAIYPGVATITARVRMDGANRCSDSTNVVVRTSPFWQVYGGDVISGGTVRSLLYPETAYLINRNGGNTEGILSYNNSITLGRSRISVPEWNAEAAGIATTIDYSQLVDRIPIGSPISTLTGPTTITQLVLNGGPSDSYGYKWFKTTGDVTFSGPINIAAGTKVVIFVEGSVNITGPITIASPKNNSFFMIVAQNDIRVNVGVGESVPTSTAPNIEGIYYTAGRFITDPGLRRLNVRGSVITAQGLLLQRNNDNDAPDEVFTFSPELILNFPTSMGTKRAFWKEVTP